MRDAMRDAGGLWAVGIWRAGGRGSRAGDVDIRIVVYGVFAWDIRAPSAASCVMRRVEGRVYDILNFYFCCVAAGGFPVSSYRHYTQQLPVPVAQAQSPDDEKHKSTHENTPGSRAPPQSPSSPPSLISRIIFRASY